ncbi:S41 family peptidase [Saprospira sp. CCB-QB6]|uniref:S41 family peptidase n=1 Tax=Saprospira sp. CCB-QB6 TaxID=3023936 RepID=UPI00234BEE4E|nr:S41 family peptidase [Saprospira sp. CCB-QB6]WCL81402.1 S41 family peptidase [Saprospira sp. CCB-QB6]
MSQHNSSNSPLSFLQKVQIWLPALIGLSLALGVYMGLLLRQSSRASYQFDQDSPHTAEIGHFNGKVEEVLRFVDARYLEGVELEELEDAAIKAILDQLDPHSNYIPSQKLQAVNESLEGNFEGIGVEFFLLDDTVSITTVLKEGPADQAGLKVGDKFLRVNDSLFAGQKLDNEDIVKRLKGPAGSSVEVTVLRRGEAQPLKIVIKRGEIPVKSVDAGFMWDDKTGYIKISRFSSKTYKEFMEALEPLVEKEGMENLVIDLRQNPGGYLKEATEILNQLFKDKRLLVYTEGRSYKRKEYKSTGRSFFKVGRVAVLIDEGSASASEIMAGAIQDNDRGIIVGRRSFGKGLVQEQYGLSDESALRLTVARYYTPSGRLIQRPYKKGDEESYDQDFESRLKSGELYEEDSIKILDSTVYKTTGGRLVYGGGGIIPDVFVPLDSLNRNDFYVNARFNLPAFVYRYLDQHFKAFEGQKADDFLRNYQPPTQLMQAFKEYLVEQKELELDPAAWQKSQASLKRYIKGYLAEQLFGEAYFYKAMAEKDPVVLAAVKGLKTE